MPTISAYNLTGIYTECAVAATHIRGHDLPTGSVPREKIIDALERCQQICTNLTPRGARSHNYVIDVSYDAVLCLSIA